MILPLMSVTEPIPTTSTNRYCFLVYPWKAINSWLFLSFNLITI